MTSDNSIGNQNTMRPDDDSGHRPSLNPGDTLGQYKVVHLLGRGGMGEVYEVENTTLEKHFALKLLPKEFGQNRNALERLRREARVMANLDHPNIVNVDEFGETEGRYWLRMELIESFTAEDENNGKKCDVRSLQELADFYNGKMPEDVLLFLITQLLQGLAYAHAKGAIHRDIKPSNILLQSSRTENWMPTVKIADFGLVRLVGEEWVRSRAHLSVSRSMSLGEQLTEVPEEHTSTRALLGTYEYMSPEQKRGEEADKRSDIYSVGLITFRLLTGEPELSFEKPSELNPGLSPYWDDIVKDTLQGRPEKRIDDCNAVLEQLRKIQPSESEGSQESTSEAHYTESYSEKESKEPDRQTESAQEGSDFTISGLGMEMVYVEPGTFQMGSEDHEAYEDEQPVHTVEISRGFWIGKYPVTQDQYESLSGENPAHFKADKILGMWGGSTIPGVPVERLSWHDALKFCKKLTERERNAGRLPDGYEYRLPSEAEWEYAARGGHKSRGYKYSGSNNADDVAWYHDNSGGKTHEVGQKQPNELGIYDMSGNVWEWCYDWYDSDFYGKSPGTDPVNTDAVSNRVIRGGCWDFSSGNVRSANRDWLGTGCAGGDLGFRVCLAPRIREP